MEELSEMIFRVSEVEAFGIKYALRVTAKTDGAPVARSMGRKIANKFSRR